MTDTDINDEIVQPLESLIAFAQFFDWTKPLQILIMQELIRLQTRLVICFGHEHTALYSRINQMIEHLNTAALTAWPIFITRLEFLLQYVKKYFVLGSGSIPAHRFIYEILNHSVQRQSHELSCLPQVLHQHGSLHSEMNWNHVYDLAWRYQAVTYDFMHISIKKGLFEQPGMLNSQCWHLLLDYMPVPKIIFKFDINNADYQKKIVMQLCLYLNSKHNISVFAVMDFKCIKILSLDTDEKNCIFSRNFLKNYLSQFCHVERTHVPLEVKDQKNNKLSDSLPSMKNMSSICSRELKCYSSGCHIQSLSDLVSLWNEYQNIDEIILDINVDQWQQMYETLLSHAGVFKKIYVKRSVMQYIFESDLLLEFKEKIGFYSNDPVDLPFLKNCDTQNIRYAVFGYRWTQDLLSNELLRANCVARLKSLEQYEISWSLCQISSFAFLGKVQQLQYSSLWLCPVLATQIEAAEDVTDHVGSGL